MTTSWLVSMAQGFLFMTGDPELWIDSLITEVKTHKEIALISFLLL